MGTQEQSSVGVVGLGSMGLGMARTLAGKGFRVIGFDLRASQRDAAASSGVEAADTIDAVFARSDLIVFSLPTAQDVASVVNAHAPLSRAGRGTRVVIVDTSTSEPDVSRALAAKLDAAGMGFLDAPVSGGPSGAAAGKLTMMIGGSEADVGLARPVIDALSAKALHVGPSGAGNVAKLVNNLLAAAHMITTSEGLRLAAAAGIDPEAALRVVNAASGRSLHQRGAFSDLDHVRSLRQRLLDGAHAQGRAAGAGAGPARRRRSSALAGGGRAVGVECRAPRRRR